MAATLTQIAKNAGVSVSLVSRFYNKDLKFPISEEKREAIMAAALKMGGCQANRAARSLSTNLAYNLVIPINQACSAYTIQHAMTAPFVSALSKALKARDFRVSVNLFDADENEDIVKNLFHPRGYCDGLVLMHGVVDEALAKTILAEHIPHVSNDPQAELHGLNTVLVDSMGGLRGAVNHLFELGHRKIGFFGSVSQADRFPQFVAAIVQKGLCVNNDLCCEIPSFAPSSLDGYQSWLDKAAGAFERWLGDGRPPASALVCQNDDVALAAVKVMKERGLEPGRDLSLVGYDNIEQCKRIDSADRILTTIDNPEDFVGRRCSQNLLNQILYGQNDIVHERLPAKLIARKTTGPCRD